jgi:steroid delta-isomerase-like uncharacterized protein
VTFPVVDPDLLPSIEATWRSTDPEASRQAYPTNHLANGEQGATDVRSGCLPRLVPKDEPLAGLSEDDLGRDDVAWQTDRMDLGACDFTSTSGSIRFHSRRCSARVPLTTAGDHKLGGNIVPGQRAMAPEDAKALVRQYTEQVWNQGNLDLIDEMVVPEYLVHTGDASQVETTEEHRAYVAALRRAVPDMHFTVEDAIAEGTKVVARIVGRGTHTRPWKLPVAGDLAPTGKRFAIQEITIYRIEDGKLAECWALIDWLDLLRQLGALPA